MSTPTPKPCAVCGRQITWRKKWERNWETVKYCSKSCRSHKLSDTDRALDAAMLAMLTTRGPGKTICPSEVARAVDADQWQDLMEPARMAARRLVASGQAQITQGGRAVDPSTARGPIRVGLVSR